VCEIVFKSTVHAPPHSIHLRQQIHPLIIMRHHQLLINSKYRITRYFGGS